MAAKSDGKTVLITGSSSGIGRATALHFQEKGWNVVATMRTPAKEKELGKLAHVKLAALDVTSRDSMDAAIAAATKTFGGIDVLVNNAGYGLSGPFEDTSVEQIRRQFDTNVIGLMEMCRAILPHFRARGGGVLVNVASMGGRLTFPLYSVYHASKWAVEGFSESLQYEVEPFNIRVKIIEPGAIKTDFYDRSADVSAPAAGASAYAGFVARATPRMKAAGDGGASPDLVAKAIFKAATDNRSKLRYPVGKDAKGLLATRRMMSDTAYMKIVKAAILTGK